MSNSCPAQRHNPNDRTEKKFQNPAHATLPLLSASKKRQCQMIPAAAKWSRGSDEMRTPLDPILLAFFLAVPTHAARPRCFPPVHASSMNYSKLYAVLFNSELDKQSLITSHPQSPTASSYHARAPARAHHSHYHPHSVCVDDGRGLHRAPHHSDPLWNDGSCSYPYPGVHDRTHPLV
jgi:hypothetical protein